MRVSVSRTDTVVAPDHRRRPSCYHLRVAVTDATPDTTPPASGTASPSQPTAAPESHEPAAAVGAAARRRLPIPPFWIVILAILALELWLFGRRGEIEVCVGKSGVHDFTLVGKPRTDDNRWSIPRCERRENLGMRSAFEAERDDAVRVACRGATTFHHRGEGPKCVAASDGWEHRVTARYVPPWDARYREQLLWFLP